VGQICAVGSGRSWETITELRLWGDLSLEAIHAVGHSNDAAKAVHQVLVKASVRYCSPQREASTKAEAIARNAQSPLFASGSGGFLARLRRDVGEPDSRGLYPYEDARKARRLLIRELTFFGPKSASDFLIGVGLADSFLALDVRLLNLLVDYLGWDPGVRAKVHNLARYEEIERDAISKLAEPLGWTGAELDRVLFQHYAHLKQAWGSPDRQAKIEAGDSTLAAEDTVC
jgi:hypothetical protein